MHRYVDREPTYGELGPEPASFKNDKAATPVRKVIPRIKRTPQERLRKQQQRTDSSSREEAERIRNNFEQAAKEYWEQRPKISAQIPDPEKIHERFKDYRASPESAPPTNLANQFKFVPCADDGFYTDFFKGAAYDSRVLSLRDLEIVDKKSFRKWLLKYHPDKLSSSGLSPSQIKEQEERVKEVLGWVDQINKLRLEALK